jgi:hypothetical protein
MLNPAEQVSELELPALWHAADRASARNQSNFYLTKGFELGGLACAAVAALVPGAFLNGIGPMVALVLFLGVLGLQLSRLSGSAESRWYDARAAAESIKSAAWQYAVGGEAFRLDDDDARARFNQVLKQILLAVPRLDIGAAATSFATVTPTMGAVRKLAQPERAAVYQRLRIEDQVSWYSRKAAWNTSRARFYLGVTVVLEVTAIVVGILRFREEADADFMGVFAAAAAAFVAWSQTKKYGFLAESYAVTSHEVRLVADTVDSPVDEDSWAQSVHDAEAAFSREHTMWQARRQGPT